MEILKITDDPVKYVTTLYESVKRWRDPYESRWKRFYKLYRSWRDPNTNPYKSNIFVPYTFSIIESVVPKMLGTLFNTRPLVAVIPRKGASESMAMLLERLLEYQFDEEQLELFNKCLEFFKEAAIYGTSFMKVFPRFKDDENISFNYIDIETLDLFNVFPDYRAKSIQRMKYIIVLSYVDFDELESLYNQGFYENVPKLVDYVTSMSLVDSYKRDRMSSIGILDEYGFDSNRRIIEVLEYWDRDYIVTIGAKKFVLKFEKNPFGGLLPFIMARYIPVQHELYGIGIPEIAESLQEELNSVRNQRMDNVNLVLNRMWIVNKYADIDFDNLISYPGNIIAANDVNAIKPVVTPDITRSAYLEEDIIKRDIDNACFDISNVDVLTYLGWKPFSKVTKDDYVATRTEDGKIEYHKPLDILIFERKKQSLYRIEGDRFINGDFTVDHKFPTVDRKFVKLYDIDEKINVPLSSKWEGYDETEYKLNGEHAVKMKDWIVFLGAYLVSGYAYKNKTGYYVCVRIPKSTSQKNKIRWAINNMGFNYWEHDKNFVISSKLLWEEVKQYGNIKNRTILSYVRFLSTSLLKLLINSAIGEQFDNYEKEFGRRFELSVKSRSLADNLQEIIIKIGYPCEIIKRRYDYKLRWYLRQSETISVKDLKLIEKVCQVGCLHVPNHVFMIRRNGRAFWTGNTGEFTYARGEPPQRRETATGIIRLQQASSIRFDTIVKMLEFSVIRNLAKMFLWLDYHFLPPEEMARIVGLEEFIAHNGLAFYKQDINEMLKQYNFQPLGTSTTAIKEVRIQQIMQAYKLFNNDPFFDQLELRKLVLDALDIRNVNRLLKPEQAMAMAQAMAQQQLAQLPQKGRRRGKGEVQPPQPPVPGQPITPLQDQLAELARVSGGGLLNRGGIQPRPVEGSMPSPAEE